MDLRYLFSQYNRESFFKNMQQAQRNPNKYNKVVVGRPKIIKKISYNF